MSMMLTTGDIEYMKSSVREVIDQWHTTITIMQPLSLEYQPNYDAILHEFTGDILYESIVVRAERKDIVNNYTNNLPPDDTEYGEKNAGTILYAIPNIIPIYDKNDNIVGMKPFRPHKEAIIIIDDTKDRYHIVSMRDRIGEILITVNRYVGHMPKGSETLVNDKIPVDGLADISDVDENLIFIGGDYHV